jgi:hypothetical protein
MSLEAATWVTAVATVLLAVGAAITATFAYQALQRQSAEVKAIEQQVSDQKDLAASQAEMLKLQGGELKRAAAERNREALERRRVQAVQVYVWQAPVHAEVDGHAIPEMTMEVYFRNTSQQPVYHLRVKWHVVTSDIRKVTYSTYYQPILMPGAEDRDRPPVSTADLAEPDDATAVVTFRDRAGVWWRSTPDGDLEEQPSPALPPRRGAGAPQPETVDDVG